MSWKDTIDKASSQIYDRMGQEWDAARETMAMTFDTRLRTMEMIYPRDPGQGAVMQHDTAKDAKQPEIEPER